MTKQLKLGCRHFYRIFLSFLFSFLIEMSPETKADAPVKTTQYKKHQNIREQALHKTLNVHKREMQYLNGQSASGPGCSEISILKWLSPPKGLLAYSTLERKRTTQV